MNARYPAMLACLSFATWMIGCVASTPKTGTLYERLQDKDPAVRIQAAVEAGNQQDRKTVPLLVDRLSDAYSDVRLYSGLALERIVGQKVYREMGWRSYDPPEARDKAIRRWRQWVEKEHGTPASKPATTQPATTQPT
jgi:hypothetical protein